MRRHCVRCPNRMDHLQMAAAPAGGSKLLMGLCRPRRDGPANRPQAWTADMAVSDCAETRLWACPMCVVHPGGQGACL